MSKTQQEINETIAANVKKFSKQILEGKHISESGAEQLQQYTGAGGLAKAGATGRGLLYEYYTPVPIVEAMWSLAYRHGFKGGKILEPSCGIGRFLKYVDPATSTVDAFEFSKDNNTSFLIAKACYPWVNFTNNYFESIFYQDNKRVIPVPSYDLVIGNPPYGTFTGLYAGDKREGKYFKGNTYDQYFIWAGVELLKQGGLLIFIIPSTFLDNATNYSDFKTALSEKAELLDAYRLPKGVFDFTDIMTDIIVLKKK